MAKKNTTFSDLISGLKKDISVSETPDEIPDIIEFCENNRYLGLPSDQTNPINLYPMQKIFLKSFYRGSPGNENIHLTDEEIELCKEKGLDNDSKGNLLGKVDRGETFRELVLILGRRSGKDFLSSIVALYEAMRLLECPGGDPFALYGLAPSNPITILTVATSKEQAKICYREIISKILRSPYFSDKYIADGITSNQCYLLTPRDKHRNKELKEAGLPLEKGSIVIEVGHSNSSSLLGKGCFVLILDEVASYKETGGSSSGEVIYQALVPSINTYYRKIPVVDKNGKPQKDENGEIIKQIVYDGKILSISSPRGKDGILYKLYQQANEVDHRLLVKLPTWEVVPNQTQENLRKSNPTMSDQQFSMEFGAEFSGSAGESFFHEDLVKQCFDSGLSQKDWGEPGKIYFLHIDPATTSHNYALVLLHKEWHYHRERQESNYKIIVDHIHYWHPFADKVISSEEVVEYICSLSKRFKIAMCTYDAFNSQESIIKITKAGIPNMLTRFNRGFKMKIYDELENLVITGNIKFPHHGLLKDEMLELQRRYDATGYKVYPRKDVDGACSDDIVDCVAGAAYQSIHADVRGLPKSKVVNTGILPQSNETMWRSMQGTPYGYGTGQQVAGQLERRTSWPMYKR